MKWGKIFLLVVLVLMLCLFAAPAVAATEGEPSVDWTPVINAVVGLAATLVTTLIPVAIRAIFESQRARLEQLQQWSSHNQQIADDVVRIVQQTGATLTNNEKYERALAALEKKLHLPGSTLSDLIENAVATAKLTWGEEWRRLGKKEANAGVCGFSPTDDVPTIPTM